MNLICAWTQRLYIELWILTQRKGFFIALPDFNPEVLRCPVSPCFRTTAPLSLPIVFCATTIQFLG